MFISSLVQFLLVKIFLALLQLRLKDSPFLFAIFIRQPLCCLFVCLHGITQILTVMDFIMGTVFEKGEFKHFGLAVEYLCAFETQYHLRPCPSFVVLRNFTPTTPLSKIFITFHPQPILKPRFTTQVY
jgi:hypothetical protein